ncbi:gamma-glutamylcyclotransferase family protein [Emcibacter nanhaiensis]|uniref:Gamma-glutamylcyclotransferase n=1 Tax=Emcibacter nanhaiensis TaxID=1505037 RepID=A0A501PFY8_9PROT|nr:gamma-glutamylcyclotransferase family protein [Emcibacter nanhaiensis]TPD58957.1 gamma-glutamylcyclotransferase [Emcibacter nanhaiensis]
MSRFTYFAYGSNLLPHRLEARCPSARFLGVATAEGFGLDFSKIGQDRSGKATIFEAGNSKVIGALFELHRDDQPALDRFEGRGYGYDRHDDFEVVTLGGQKAVSCRTYIAPDEHRAEDLLPWDWYLQLVLAGTLHHDMPEDYVARFRAQSHAPHHDEAHPGRKEAHEILRAAGYHNLRPGAG